MIDLLKSTGRFLRKNVFHFQCSDFPRENETGLYVEDYFQEMVYLERSRSDEGVKLPFHAVPSASGGGGAIPVDFNLYPDLKRRDEVKKRPLSVKRAVDVAGSLFGILLFSPFFVAVPVIIKLTSRGPVLYRQKRIGEFGREFTFLKFRSMHDGADDKPHSEYVKRLIREDKAYSGALDRDGQVFKIKNDPRITPIGKFLRKTSLDELPQFFNVLRGDMSLVGR